MLSLPSSLKLSLLGFSPKSFLFPTAISPSKRIRCRYKFILFYLYLLCTLVSITTLTITKNLKNDLVTPIQKVLDGLIQTWIFHLTYIRTFDMASFLFETYFYDTLQTNFRIWLLSYLILIVLGHMFTVLC